MPSPHSSPPASTRRSCEIVFCEHSMLLDGRGIVFWPAHRLLIVSDLHFEKGSFLAAQAHALPGYDSQDTLERLREIIDAYQPHTVVSLGDSFHDANAFKRLTQQQCDAINQLVAHVERFVWVLGNHDPDIDHCIKGERAAHLKIANIMLTHEPEDTPMPQIIGHFHPKTTVKRARQKLRGRCFLQSKERLLMPAFGSYTGGLDASHKAINTALLEQPAHCHMLYRDAIWPNITRI